MADDFAGSLRERVGIEAWIDSRDDSGGSVGYWQQRGFADAAVVPDTALSTRSAEGEARRSNRRWRVTLRTLAGLGLSTRLVWGSRMLTVLGVESDPRMPDRTVLRCEARGG